MGRRMSYYHPGKNPQPKKPIDGTTAKVVKETRQIRRAREREARKGK